MQILQASDFGFNFADCINDHLWHRYSVSVDQVIVMIKLVQLKC
jgi:hypothetical protein